MRLLALLIGFAAGSGLEAAVTGNGQGSWSAGDGQGVLELLARALSERPDAIDHLEGIVEHLRRSPNGRSVLPRGLGRCVAAGPRGTTHDARGRFVTIESQDGRARALSDFQRTTAAHAFRRLYRDQDSSRRFLVADETGLGKTHVAQEVIALTLEHLQQVDRVRRIDIVYVCSNADIAAQNIRKLNVTGSETPSFATRLSLLITKPDVLTPTGDRAGKPATFVAFTPATSFQFGWQLGTAAERAVLYVLLRNHLGLRGARATAAQRIFQGFVASRRRFVKVIRRSRSFTALRIQHPPDVSGGVRPELRAGSTPRTGR